jgi:hypothetical protein
MGFYQWRAGRCSCVRYFSIIQNNLFTSNIVQRAATLENQVCRGVSGSGFLRMMIKLFKSHLDFPVLYFCFNNTSSLTIWSVDNQAPPGTPGAIRVPEHLSARAISSLQRLHTGLCGPHCSECSGHSGVSGAIVGFPDVWVMVSRAIRWILVPFDC